MKRRVHSDNVNYLKYAGKRKMLAHYLKAGGFKKIGGSKIHGNYTDRRRYFVAASALIILLTGLYFVFF
ncbi:MAG: hypothetical protein WAX69_16050 [Victivallales bacterium]